MIKTEKKRSSFRKISSHSQQKEEKTSAVQTPKREEKNLCFLVGNVGKEPLIIEEKKRTEGKKRTKSNEDIAWENSSIARKISQKYNFNSPYSKKNTEMSTYLQR